MATPCLEPQDLVHHDGVIEEGDDGGTQGRCWGQGAMVGQQVSARTGRECAETFGPLSESVLLGNVSYRLGGKKLDWDPALLRATNCPEADSFIATRMREGWTL